MIRTLVGALTLVCCVTSASAESTAAGGRSLSMQFERWQEGPAEACGTRCRTWISAIGTITPDTPLAFAQFARNHDVRGATLVLDSGGGSVHGAIALGRAIRDLSMTTSVGRTIALDAPGKATVPRARLSPRADCESMCVFVLLAGTSRMVPPEARLMVHQIWLGDRRDDAAAATYSAADMVLVQRDVGRLAKYTVEMGGSIDLLELALRVPPWEAMRRLSREELSSMQVETAPAVAVPAPDRPPTTAAAPATSAAASAPSGSNGARRSSNGPGGWTAVTQAGRVSLVRAHPLTVEGTEIGSFDLTLACGEAPDTLRLAYRERRTAAPISLKSVAVSFGLRSENLELASSTGRPEAGELRSEAHGSIPASVVSTFAESSRSSLRVEIVSADEERTEIRVGNAGLAEIFGRLRDGCARQQLHATRAQP